MLSSPLITRICGAEVHTRSCRQLCPQHHSTSASSRLNGTLRSSPARYHRLTSCARDLGIADLHFFRTKGKWGVPNYPRQGVLRMRRVNVHLEEQQLEGLRELEQRTGVPVNTLVGRAVARLLADTKKHGLSSLVFNDQSSAAEPTQSK